MTSPFEEYLRVQGARVERALRRYAAPRRLGPDGLAASERYSLFAGGKRLRPVLVLAAAQACGGDTEKALPTACALEMIHTYSLIHDDLPAMDDDDLRRGRPTNHRVYGEALAILAGDGLLTRAFGLIAETTALGVPAERVCEVLRLVSEAAGGPGMVGGQVLDILNTGEQRTGNKVPGTDERAVLTLPRQETTKVLAGIHKMKTAALITAALESGAVIAGASADRRRALREYGQAVGLAFQIVDDILDRVGDKRKLGKRGSDLDNAKLTYPAVYGLEASREEAARLIVRAHRALKPFGPAARALRAAPGAGGRPGRPGDPAGPLHDLAEFIKSRDR
jgi:geranylgeranyl diphosphate synthase type II